MDLTFLSAVGEFAEKNGVALLVLIWTANKILLPIVNDLRSLLRSAEPILVKMGHDVADLKSSGCARMQPPPPPSHEPPPTLPISPLSIAH